MEARAQNLPSRVIKIMMTLLMLTCLSLATGGCEDAETVVVVKDAGPLGDGICLPNCKDMECGDDGCGGQCGTCKGSNTCNEDGTCECEPDCSDKNCGDDGCGGNCGVCAFGNECVLENGHELYGQCVCAPDCNGKNCGDNGCEGSCGVCGEEDKCSDQGQCVPAVLPATPSDLVAVVVSTSQIDLSWVDNADNEKGYKVERGDDGINFSVVKALAPDANAYQNGGLQNNTTYHYRVRAYHTGGDSDASQVVQATTLNASAPEWLTETVEPDGFVGVSGGAAIAIDNAKNQHIAFVSTDGALRYAFRTNSVDAQWTFKVIDDQVTADLPAIRVPKFGEVHISYAASNPTALKYATLDDEGMWILEKVDDSSFTTGYASAIYTSEGEVFISYLETEAASQGTLRFAHKNSDGHWNLEKVADVKYPESQAYTGIGRELTGGLHISYADANSLMHAHKPASANTWTTDIIDDTGIAGNGSGLGVETTGKVHVAYSVWGDTASVENSTGLKHGTYSSSGWEIETVETVDKGQGLRFPRMVVDQGKLVHLAYVYDPEILRYATNRSGEWKIYDVDANNEEITHTYLAVDQSGTPYMVYVDGPSQTLKYVKGKL